ncbi:MAG: dihydroorotate dehydrogenase electron transfer subunit [Lachnospiraceae bacterium]|nr:dihydroorotate dehydrogenase electron transfer subunit [Lachnospiraceae bacterium]
MADKKKTVGRVLDVCKLSDGIYDMKIKTELSRDAKPGQFVGVFTKDSKNLLPRPISICEADKDEETLRLVFRTCGEGTREFATYKKEDEVELLGVLGNGFPIEKACGKSVMVMGGGIGIPPIVELSKKLSEMGITPAAVVGYRDSETFLKTDLEKYAKVYIATADGSVGAKGTVMDAVALNNISCDVIFACGPMPMLKAIKDYAHKTGIKAYISLEERMACGVGACLGCVTKTVNVDHHSHVNNARICTDGPVFDADEVDI